MELLKRVSYPSLRLTSRAVRWSLLASEDGSSEGVNDFYFLSQRQLVLSQMSCVQGIVIKRNLVKSFAGQSEVENMLHRREISPFCQLENVNQEERKWETFSYWFSWQCTLVFFSVFSYVWDLYVLSGLIVFSFRYPSCVLVFLFFVQILVSSETCEVTFCILNSVTVCTVKWLSLISCCYCLIVVTIRVLQM